MRSYILIFIALQLLSGIAMAQIGGISGSKLGAYCADVVDHNKLEFEPGICYNSSSAYWTNDYGLVNHFATPDSFMVDNKMYVRITYGLKDRFEFGGVMSHDLVSCNLGFKCLFLQKRTIEIAAIAGFNTPLMIPGRNKNLDTALLSKSIGAGLISTAHFNENASADFTAQMMVPLGSDLRYNELNQLYNLDFGYFIHDKHVQLVVGVGYNRISTKTNLTELLSVCHGLTLEQERYIIVACLTNDILGRNIEKSNGALLAITLTF